MNLKMSIGLVAHKLVDWKTVVNPITQRFYPKVYRFSIKNWLPSFRKKTTQIYYSSPIPSLMIDGLTNYPHLYFYDFPSLYPYNQVKMIDNWIKELKRMGNYFSGFGNIETQDTELNQLAFAMRDKIQAYRKRRFEIDKTDNDVDFDIDRSISDTDFIVTDITEATDDEN